jgi:hypothetical protein
MQTRGPELGLGPEKVRREIQLQARLDHVNIVQLQQVRCQAGVFSRVSARLSACACLPADSSSELSCCGCSSRA